MMGETNPQRALFYQLSLEGFVPSEHPLRRVRPFIDDQAIRRACRPLYSDFGRPSIPPEQLFLALIGGYLLGIPSERKLVMELQCNMALRWFVGLNPDQDAWNASTFSQNRRRRFDASGVLQNVNALMENRNRILMGIGVEIFRSSASETEGCTSLLDRAKRRLRFAPATIRADKGYFSERLASLLPPSPDPA